MNTINERTSCTVEFDLVDQAGAAVPASALDSFTLTLYNKPKYGGATAIINARDKQNVLNAGGVTVSAQGHVVWTYVVADGAIIDDTQDHETHVALFEATWAGGVGGVTYEVVFDVTNIRRTP